MKKGLVTILAAVMLLSVIPAEAVSADGWYADSDGWHYRENGTMLRNAWKRDSTEWCYLDGSGHMLCNGYAWDSAGQHYLDSTGHMVW